MYDDVDNHRDREIFLILSWPNLGSSHVIADSQGQSGAK
jgi:hypothetical protein